MKEIEIQDKQQYLEENYPFSPVPKLSDKMWCIHCGKQFTVGDYKVFKGHPDGMEYICCPNFLENGGTVIDWVVNWGL